MAFVAMMNAQYRATSATAYFLLFLRGKKKKISFHHCYCAYQRIRTYLHLLIKIETTDILVRVTYIEHSSRRS